MFYSTAAACLLLVCLAQPAQSAQTHATSGDGPYRSEQECYQEQNDPTMECECDGKPDAITGGTNFYSSCTTKFSRCSGFRCPAGFSEIREPGRVGCQANGKHDQPLTTPLSEYHAKAAHHAKVSQPAQSAQTHATSGDGPYRSEQECYQEQDNLTMDCECDGKPDAITGGTNFYSSCTTKNEVFECHCPEGFSKAATPGSVECIHNGNHDSQSAQTHFETKGGPYRSKQACYQEQDKQNKQNVDCDCFEKPDAYTGGTNFYSECSEVYSNVGQPEYIDNGNGGGGGGNGGGRGSGQCPGKDMTLYTDCGNYCQGPTKWSTGEQYKTKCRTVDSNVGQPQYTDNNDYSNVAQPTCMACRGKDTTLWTCCGNECISPIYFSDGRKTKQSCGQSHLALAPASHDEHVVSHLHSVRASSSSSHTAAVALSVVGIGMVGGVVLLVSRKRNRGKTHLEEPLTCTTNDAYVSI